MPVVDKVLKYVAVKRAILDRLESDEYRVNQLIPSERELMEIFGVSRITIRKALDSLVQDGRLNRVQGKGTYVADGITHDLISLISFTEDMQSRGMLVGRQVLEAHTVSADEEVAAQLRIEDGSPIFELNRVFFADGRPINWTVSHLPSDIFPDIESHDFTQQSLYALIEGKYRVKITKARRMLEAVLATDQAAELLGVETGDPLIRFHCETHGELPDHGLGVVERVIETFTCWYRTDQHKFYINQVR